MQKHWHLCASGLCCLKWDNTLGRVILAIRNVKCINDHPDSVTWKGLRRHPHPDALLRNCHCVNILFVFSSKAELSYEKYMNGFAYPVGEETKPSIK